MNAPDLDGIDWSASAVDVYEAVEERIVDANPNAEPDHVNTWTNTIVLARLA